MPLQAFTETGADEPGGWVRAYKFDPRRRETYENRGLDRSFGRWVENQPAISPLGIERVR